MFISLQTHAAQSVISCKNKNMKFELAETENVHILDFFAKKTSFREKLSEIASDLTGASNKFKSGSIVRNYIDSGRYIKSENSIESLIWVQDNNISFTTNQKNIVYLPMNVIPVVFYEIQKLENGYQLEISYYKNHKIIEVFETKNCVIPIL